MSRCVYSTSKTKCLRVFTKFCENHLYNIKKKTKVTDNPCVRIFKVLDTKWKTMRPFFINSKYLNVWVFTLPSFRRPRHLSALKEGGRVRRDGVFA